jgi:hypothetical protein
MSGYTPGVKTGTAGQLTGPDTFPLSTSVMVMSTTGQIDASAITADGSDNLLLPGTGQVQFSNAAHSMGHSGDLLQIATDDRLSVQSDGSSSLMVGPNGSWVPDGYLGLGGDLSAPNVVMYSGGDNVLDVRNGSDPQTLRVFGDYTSDTDFECLTIAAQPGGPYLIYPDKGSAGGTNHSIRFFNEVSTSGIELTKSASRYYISCGALNGWYARMGYNSGHGGAFISTEKSGNTHSTVVTGGSYTGAQNSKTESAIYLLGSSNSTGQMQHKMLAGGIAFQDRLSSDAEVASISQQGKARFAELQIDSPSAPSAASDTGEPGSIAWDSGHVYVCVSANTWKRVALSAW